MAGLEEFDPSLLEPLCRIASVKVARRQVAQGTVQAILVIAAPDRGQRVLELEEILSWFSVNGTNGSVR
jgi:hypothetical protein